MSDWTVLKILQWTTDYFSKQEIEGPRLDAELLLAHVLGFSRIQLYTLFDQPLNDEELKNFKALIKRRATREPLAYILGKREFYSLEFKVTSSVLIPRPETELLVDEVLKKKEDHLKILDIGTGSGCIPISLAKHLPQSEIWAIDFSKEALAVAQQNAKKHEVCERIHFLEGDILKDTKHLNLSDFDFILSNPPYVTTSEMKALAPELSYEPQTALHGGTEGIDYYPSLFNFVKNHLKITGTALFEMGADQGKILSKIAKEMGFSQVEILKDLAQHDRVLKISQ